MNSSTFFFCCLLCTAVLLLDPARVCAQEQESASPSPDRTLALGAHVGFPTGLSLKLETPGNDYDLLLAWNLNSFFYAHSHVLLFEQSLPREPRLHYYAGPGLAVHGNAGQLRTGLSGNAGIRFELRPFEFFGQITPRLEIVPATQLGFNAGAGLRVFL